MGNYRVTLFPAPYLRLYEVNFRSRVRNIRPRRYKVAGGLFIRYRDGLAIRYREGLSIRYRVFKFFGKWVFIIYNGKFAEK